MPDQTIEDRLRALEARSLSSLDREDARLVEGVERLGASTAALTAVLTQVDEQARQIANVERKTDSVNRKAEEVAFTVEERVATAQVERRLALRRTYAAALLATICSIVAVIGGAELTDQHIQNCLLHGPGTARQQMVCNWTFPGHNHPTDLSLDALLRAGATGQHRACLTNNQRTQIQIDRERRLARADLTQNRAIHQESAQELTKLLVDCDRVAPLPSSGHHD